MTEHISRSLVSEENRLGLYITIPLYFCILGFVAWISYRRIQRMQADGVADQLTSHYLGGRAFGEVTIAGTVFASLFSGYTVIGIPNESFRRGFYGFRWMPSTAYIAMGYIGTGVRLRKASVVRNHQTPVDFITDRFRSHLLRYSIVTIQVLASLIYLAAQVNALKSTFNAMFGFDPDDVWPVIVIMAIILAFEWAGGLAVIALSDSIQGLIMLLSFVMIPIVIRKNFGGWTSLDPTTYPRPDFYQTPSKDDQWNFWQFSLINIAFFALPHLMQRIYAARDIRALKVGFATMAVGPWITMFVGVFIGTMGVQIIHDAGGDPNPSSPFTAIMEEIMNLGGFAKGAAIIALTASLAAIMSTADSLILAISQLVTVECVWPFKAKASQRTITWIGRFTSLASTIVALLTGILWKSGVSALTAINFPIIVQAIPAYIVGLYATDYGEFHPWSLVSGAWAGLMYVFAFFFGYLYQNPSAAPVNAGITGLILNCVASIVTELFFYRRNKMQILRKQVSFSSTTETKEYTDSAKERGLVGRPDWDHPCIARFGEKPLTAGLLNLMMKGFPEPFRVAWYNLFFFVAVSIVTPLVASGQPVLTAQDEFDPPTYRGLPWWFFKQILFCIVPYVMICSVLWDMPKEYPFDEKEIDKEGVEPETLEMTPKELNFRQSFDAPNDSILHRRSIVSMKMQELGIRSSLQKDEETAIPKDLRLSSVILKEQIHAMAIEESEEGEEEEDGEKGAE